MKTLYVSDLDGTLLNGKKEITPYTADILNRFIYSGDLFSIATARMVYGCDYKLSTVDFNIPVILMNGVCIYDLKHKKYNVIQSLGPDKVHAITKILDRFECNAFMYDYCNHALSIYYIQRDLSTDSSQYLSERAKQSCSEIRETDGLSTVKYGEVIYFALTGTQELVNEVKDKLAKVTGIGMSAYLNIYNGLYCLEIYSNTASKENTLLKLKEITGAERVVVFGDNHNDIGMMRRANESYAPQNAVEEAKQAADGIIGSNDDDGVARFIMEKCLKQQMEGQ